MARMLGMVALASSAMVAAAYNRPPLTDNFDDIDTDKSGHASDAEIGQHLDRQFANEAKAWIKFYDTDNDGKVHKDEYFAKDQSSEDYWETSDTNHDGFVDTAEMKANRDESHPDRVNTFITYYDGDSDGKVHKDEFVSKHSEL